MTALRSVLVTGIATLATLAAGCGGNASTSDSGANGTSSAGGVPQTPADLDEIYVLRGVPAAAEDFYIRSYPDDPDTLNVVTASDNVSTEMQNYVCELLANQDFHDPDKFVPALAESWELDEETLTFTLHLRKGVKWHPVTLPNGTVLKDREFTARDVKFTFDCVLNPSIEAAHIRSYYEDPDAEDESQRYKIRVDVIDDYTVTVQWTKPYMLAEEFTLGGLPMIPRHVYSVDEEGEPISFDFSSREFAEGFNNHWANSRMVGTGPLMFRNWDRDQRLELVRNPDYWGEPFFFSHFTFRCITNANTAVQQALQNEIDWGGIREKDQYFQEQTNPNVTSGKTKLVAYDYPGYRFISYNFRNDFLKEKNVRWALSHATPVDKIIGEVFKGLAVRTTGPFMHGSSSYDSSIEPVAFDLDRAAELLEEAGWKDTDEDGIRDKMVDGQKVDARFDLIIFSESTSFRTIAEIYQENCRKIGVEVLVTPTKWALMLQKLNKKEFGAAMLGWAMPWRQDPFQIWHGSLADVPDSSNAGAYSNPEVDALIDELRITLNRDKQIEIYHQIHRLIYEDQPYTFLFSEQRTAAHDARLENIEFYKIRPGYDLREWHTTTPRRVGS